MSAFLNLPYTSFYGAYFKHCLVFCQRVFSSLWIYRINLQAGFAKLSATESCSFFHPFTYVLCVNICCTTLKSLILAPSIAKGKNCGACIGTRGVLHSFIANLFKNISGAFSLGLSGKAPMRQEDRCGKLSYMYLCSLKCHLTLAAVEVGGLGSVRPSQTDVLSPKVSHETCKMKKICLRSSNRARKKQWQKNNPFFFFCKKREIWIMWDTLGSTKRIKLSILRWKYYVKL